MSKPDDDVSELTKSVAAHLRTLIAAADTNKSEVSRRAKLSQSTGGLILRGKKSPTLDQLQRISHALGTTLIDVLIGAGRP